jgi:integrase
MRLHRLSSRFCQTAAPRQHPYSDGGNLYLDASKSKSGEHVNRSWVFIYQVAGTKAEGRHRKNRHMGLGSYPDVSIVQAREQARQCRELLRQGHDPLDHLRGQKMANIAARESRVTFRDEAEAYIELHRAGWSPRFAYDWQATLRQHAFPKLGKMAVSEIVQADVLNTIQPIWISHTHTAGRVLNRIERVLDFANAKGHRTGDNPAANLRQSLPKASKISPTENYAALHYEKVPELMSKLDKAESLAARAVRFLILTAARSGEVVGADWNEIEGDLWTVPGARMKAGRRHRVPLSGAALDCLTDMPAKRPQGFNKAASNLPKTTTRTGRIFPLDPHAMRRELIRLGIEGTTIHGFRSSFRQWAQERTSYPRAVVELSLAHNISENGAEKAYLRNADMIDARRKLMDAWAAYCLSPAAATGGKVVTLRKA